MPVKQLSTVERAFRVLVAISEHQPIGLTALARLLDVDRGAIQRILATLDAIGWIAPAVPASDGWVLTPQALIIGRRCAPGLRTAARPLLEALAAESGETGLLVMVDRGRVVVVDVIDSTQPLRVSVPLGFDAPLTDFEPFLAFFSDAELAALGLGGSLSISSEATDALRQQGWYALEMGAVDVAAVGAPVHGPGGAVVAALILVGPRSRWDPSEQERFGQLARDAARRLDARFLDAP